MASGSVCLSEAVWVRIKVDKVVPEAHLLRAALEVAEGIGMHMEVLRPACLHASFLVWLSWGEGHDDIRAGWQKVELSLGISQLCSGFERCHVVPSG